MRTLNFPNGLSALVDNDSFERIKNEYNKYSWTAQWRDRCSTYYVQASIPKRGGGHTTIYLHQLIMGRKKGHFIDHINHNGLDCRDENLRFVTPAQSTWNRRKRRGEYSSPYKGVSWQHDYKKWIACIRKNGRGYTIGRFADPIKAALAYNQKATELFGEFACLNDIRARAA